MVSSLCSCYVAVTKYPRLSTLGRKNVLVHGPGGGEVLEHGACIYLASGEDAPCMAEKQKEEAGSGKDTCKGGREAVQQHTPW